MDTAGPDLAVAISCIIAGLGGIAVNGALIAVILSNKELRGKDFIAFILNRAVYDLLFSINLATFQPIAILTTEPTSTPCVVSAFLVVVFVTGSICSELLLACNRYVSILKNDQYKTIYTKRNIYLMCACSPLVAVLSATPHLFTNILGRITGEFCGGRFSTETGNFLVAVSANYTFVFGIMAVMLYFNLKMYFYLKRYQDQPMTNSQRTQLQNDREVLRYIFVVAFLPVIFQSPVLIICSINVYYPVSGWLIFAGACLILISFAACPLITLTMVRPIRVQALARLGKVFPSFALCGNRVGPTG